MPNPNQVTCLVDAWTKVATNVITDNGSLWKMNSVPSLYLYTYRLTGQAAPTLKTEGVPIFQGCNKNHESISASGIDLYIFPVNEAGQVRVDV